MNTYRLGFRDSQGNKQVAEVDNVPSFLFARDFVIREAKASVCLALVNPIEPKPAPELVPFTGTEAA